MELDAFTKAYVEAALWSSNDERDDSGGQPLDRNYSANDIHPDAMKIIIADCTKFQTDNADLLTEDFCLTRLSADVQGGHDFWLTRNGHGCGFWETSDWESDAGDRLTKSAHSFGEINLYVGDDGFIHYQ